MFARGGMGTPLLAGLRRGRRGDIARAISIVENDPGSARDMVAEIFARTGWATTIGITGPAGAGKSTLIDRASVELRRLGANPAVLAVDPTSHVTGGAILGDRVRMTESTDSGTYIRSVASRGAAGAVSRSVRGISRVLEYAGFDPIIVESVGAGQTEVGISAVADITVVVFSPQTGDSIQAVKAGLTEIGDIYVVNKGDLDGASQLYDALLDHVASSLGGTKGGDQETEDRTTSGTAKRGKAGPAPGANHKAGDKSEINKWTRTRIGNRYKMAYSIRNRVEGSPVKMAYSIRNRVEGSPVKMAYSIRNRVEGSLGPNGRKSDPAVVMVSAKKGKGTSGLAKTLFEMMDVGDKDVGEGKRLEVELRDIILNMQRERLDRMLDPTTNRSYAAYLRKVRAREIDPHEAARRFTARMGRGAGGRP